MPEKIRYSIIVHPSRFNTLIDCPDLKLRFNLNGHPPIKTLLRSCAAKIKQEILSRNANRQKVPLPGKIPAIQNRLPTDSDSFVLEIECDDEHKRGCCESLALYSAYPLQIIDSSFDAFISFLALSIASKDSGMALPILGIIVLFTMDIFIFIGVDAPRKLQNIGKYVDDLCRNEPAAQENRSRTSCKERSLNLASYALLHALACMTSAVYALTTYHSLMALANKGDAEGTRPDWLNEEVSSSLGLLSAIFAFISNLININSVAHEVVKKCSKPFLFLSKRRNSDDHYMAMESPSQ